MKYGPQTSEVETLIKRARILTYDEVRGLEAAWDAARQAAGDAALYAAWEAAWDAARYADREAAWEAAWDAALYAAWEAAWEAAWDDARDAAQALVVRDLISSEGFTQEHYDLLTGPWAQVIGPVHPHDALREKP